MKIGVIGAGAVGSACLLSSILRGPARERKASADRRSLVRLRAKRYGETSTKLEERSRGGVVRRTVDRSHTKAGHYVLRQCDNRSTTGAPLVFERDRRRTERDLCQRSSHPPCGGHRVLHSTVPDSGLSER
jgi:hypothetical protein